MQGVWGSIPLCLTGIKPKCVTAYEGKEICYTYDFCYDNKLALYVDDAEAWMDKHKNRGYILQLQ